MIAAHYGFSDVFDNLIISLCKFTTLSSEVNLWILSKLLRGTASSHWTFVCPVLCTTVCRRDQLNHCLLYFRLVLFSS